jgi:hypothetical protein
MTDSAHSMNLRGARLGVSIHITRREANMSDIKSRKLRRLSPPDGKAAFYGMEFQLYCAFNLTTALREMLLSAKSEDNEPVAMVAAFRP